MNQRTHGTAVQRYALVHTGIHIAEPGTTDERDLASAHMLHPHLRNKVSLISRGSEVRGQGVKLPYSGRTVKNPRNGDASLNVTFVLCDIM
jgi:hypothetical protein